MPTQSPVTDFIKHHYRHFNAASLVDAAEGYNKLLNDGGKMFVTLAGAMSTAELGCSLAEMIRQDKVHAISCTGANLEEDLFNLVAHKSYKRVPHYRDLSPEDEQELLDQHFNRVTDTCIPEDEAMRRVESFIQAEWQAADKKGERLLPHEFMFRVIEKWEALPLEQRPYDIDPKDSWLVAAFHKKIPLFVPGWEDSTLGNIFVSQLYKGKIESTLAMRPGVDYMKELIDWYMKTTEKHSIGFFQVGGGIAGDFPICVVPLITQDIKGSDAKLWAYFCQISDSTTSYGSYSGAVPNEKITWGKLGIDTPKYVIESDASIVAPLVFAYVLGW